MKRILFRWFWRLRRPFGPPADGLRVSVLNGTRMIVLPGVFDGVTLRTGLMLAQAVDERRCPPGTRVLDLGTGSGIGALAAARRGAHVVATDINPEAARCAQVNALAHHLEQQIETRVGDLFAPVPRERFDLILFNPPYYRGEPRDLADHAWRSPDAFDRFLRELPEHLSPSGCALVVLSTDGEIMDALGAATHLTVRTLEEGDLHNERLSVFELRAKP